MLFRLNPGFVKRSNLAGYGISMGFYARQQYQRVLAMAVLSVCLSGVSQQPPGTKSSPSEIETLGFHHMIA